MTTPRANADPSPGEIDPLEKSDIGKDETDRSPTPYSSPVGGMGADADTAPQLATAGMGADAETTPTGPAGDDKGSG